MRRLIVFCMALIIVALGLVACASSSDMSPAAQPWSTYRVYEMRDFDLPLTGGQGSIFSGSRRENMAMTQAPVPELALRMHHSGDMADADDSMWVQVDSLPQYEELGWDDVAGSGERHVIQTANVELDTEYFEDVTEELRQLAPSVNGFVESSMSTAHGRRRFTIVMRVPAASFDMVLRHVESLAYVRFSNQWAQDVTDRFYDMVGSYEIRRLEEERILALIDEAENVQELLALEQRLSSVRLSIEMYLSQLNNMAGQIAYSTISVTLFDISEEPVVIVGPTLGERIGGAFGDSVDGTISVVQGIIVFLAAAVVPLTLIGLAAVVIYLIVRVKAKKTLWP